MPYDYKLGKYRLHSITKIAFTDEGETTFKTVDFMEGLAIEKKTSSDSDSYIVIAFVKPSDDGCKYLNVKFVADRITNIEGPEEFNIFMDLYYMANRVIYGDDGRYSKKPADGEAPLSEKSVEATADTDGQPIHTNCLICGEEIIGAPANPNKFIDPHIQVCEKCRNAIATARANLEWDEEVETW